MLNIFEIARVKLFKTSKNTLSISVALKGGVSFLDQGLLSLTSLTVGILLIKLVPQEEYGYYSIARIIFLFLVSVQNALITTPLTVLLNSTISKKEYVSGLFKGQYIFILPAVTFVIFLTGALYYFGLSSNKAIITIAVCLSCIGNLYREFLRGYYFAIQNVFSVLKIDLLYLLMYFIFIGIAVLNFTLSVAYNFIFIGFSAALISLITNTHFLHNVDMSIVKSCCSKNWKYGKWALLGVIIQHIHGRGYLYLIGIIIGSTAVAEVSASQLLLMPIPLIQGAWGKIALASGANLRNNDMTKHFFFHQLAFTLIMVVFTAVYVLTLIKGSDILIKYIFTDKYPHTCDYLIIWGGIVALSSVAANASYGLQVMLKFNTLAKLNFTIMIATIGFCVVLIFTHGTKGALSGVLMGNILSSIVLWCFFYRSYLHS